MTISEFALSRVGCGYVYGATGWVCTPGRRRQQAEQYPEQARNCLVVASKWDGKVCYDCAQLVKAAAKQAGIALPSGATSQWNADVWREKGALNPAAIAEMAGDTIVFRQDKKSPGKMAHVGIYIGSDFVVEAKGAESGVVKTPFSKGGWTHFGVLEKGEEAEGLGKGSKGKEVRQLQAALNDLGYDCGKTDGIFGEKTEAAVRNFQAEHGLAEDGTAGEKTCAEIKAATEKNCSKRQNISAEQAEAIRQMVKQFRDF